MAQVATHGSDRPSHSAHVFAPRIGVEKKVDVRDLLRVAEQLPEVLRSRLRRDHAEVDPSRVHRREPERVPVELGAEATERLAVPVPDEAPGSELDRETGLLCAPAEVDV